MSGIMGIAGKVDPLTGLFNNLLGGLFGGNEKDTPPPAPVVEPPPPMPLPDDAAVQAAKKRSIAMQLQRRGRDSTIMSGTDSGDTLG